MMVAVAFHCSTECGHRGGSAVPGFLHVSFLFVSLFAHRLDRRGALCELCEREPEARDVDEHTGVSKFGW